MGIWEGTAGRHTVLATACTTRLSAYFQAVFTELSSPTWSCVQGRVENMVRAGYHLHDQKDEFIPQVDS